LGFGEERGKGYVKEKKKRRREEKSLLFCLLVED
jgi:hypothetical protein